MERSPKGFRLEAGRPFGSGEQAEGPEALRGEKRAPKGPEDPWRRKSL